MRVLTNDKLIKRRAKLGQYINFAGLGVLVIGMVVSFRSQPTDPNYQLLMFATLGCLVIGFVAASVGGYNIRRFGRSPRPDERLAKELEGFDDRYVFFSWMTSSPYTLVGPSGVYIFIMRDHSGKIVNTGDKWKGSFSIVRLLTSFGQEGLGNPTLESQQEAKKLQDFLAKNLPDLTVEVQPIVLFVHPKVELQLSNPTVPVVQPKSLKALMRQRTKDKRLNAQALQQIEALFTSSVKS